MVLAKSDLSIAKHYDEVLVYPVDKSQMKRGESVILTIQPTYAFGEQGKDIEEGFVVIPTNATITMSLELASFKTVK